MVDYLNQPIEDEFVDGLMQFGIWVVMTPESHKDIGVGLGTGRGQRYRKQPDGRFLLVEGY